MCNPYDTCIIPATILILLVLAGVYALAGLWEKQDERDKKRRKRR